MKAHMLKINFRIYVWASRGEGGRKSRHRKLFKTLVWKRVKVFFQEFDFCFCFCFLCAFVVSRNAFDRKKPVSRKFLAKYLPGTEDLTFWALIVSVLCVLSLRQWAECFLSSSLAEKWSSWPCRWCKAIKSFFLPRIWGCDKVKSSLAIMILFAHPWPHFRRLISLLNEDC